MTIKEISEQYLRANGYDGLCSYECGCLLGDFMPCQQPDAICRPGYKHTGDSEAEWYVREEKP